MNTVVQIAASTCEAFQQHGLTAIVVGGSAVTLFAPDVYRSLDIDLAVPAAPGRSVIDEILASIGFTRRGRNYVNPDTPFTLDYVADAPRIDNRIITDFRTMSTPFGTITTLDPEDALADRIAHFVFWDDRQSLTVALEALRKYSSSVSSKRLLDTVANFNVPSPDMRARLELAIRRIRKIE